MKRKDFLSLIPFLGGVLIYCGSLKLVVFYWLFEINIISYVDLSEILTAFIGEAILLFLFYQAISLIFLFGLVFVSVMIGIPILYRVIVKKSKPEFAFIGSDFPNIRFLFISLNLISVIIGLFYVNKVHAILTQIFFVNLTLTICYSFNELFFAKNFNAKKLGLLIFINSIFLGSYAAYSGYEQAKNIKELKDYNHVTFCLGDQTIQSNDNLQYIGRTKNYIFLIENSKNELSIYLVNEIKNFKLTVNKIKVKGVGKELH